VGGAQLGGHLFGKNREDVQRSGGVDGKGASLEKRVALGERIDERVLSVDNKEGNRAGQFGRVHTFNRHMECHRGAPNCFINKKNKIFLAREECGRIVRVHMEWHIAPISRKSAMTDTAFEKDDRVASLLIRQEEEIVREDVLESEEASFEYEGELICRWTQIHKPRSNEEKEAQEAMKLTADNLFISLFDGEEGPTQENAKLKHLLGLMLERRRLLRVKARDPAFTHYIHRPTKNEYSVPNVELDPEFFIENQEKLAFLGAAGSEDSEKSEKKAKSPSSVPGS